MLDTVLGFDAGGTRTECAVMTLDGRLLGTGVSGPGNFQLVRESGIGKVIKESAEIALNAAGAHVRVLAAFVGMAGATRLEERRAAKAVCEQLNLSPQWRVMGDMVPALAAGTHGREGIVIISGTGAICWGCDASGTSARASGWGYLLGDEGSGFHIAQRGLIAALQSFDGRGPKTSLVNRILHAIDCPDMEAMIAKVYGEDVPRPWIAALAPVVVEAAADGDAVASEILEAAAHDHVAAILAVYRRLDFNAELTVVATGGLFQNTDVLFQRVRVLLSEVLPDATLIVPKVEPVLGACYLASRMVQGDPWPPEQQQQ